MKWSTLYSPIGLEIGSSQLKMAQLKGQGQHCAIHEIAVVPIPNDENIRATDSREQVVRCIATTLATSAFVGKKTVSMLPCVEVDIRTVQVPLHSDSQDIQSTIRQKAKSYLPYDIEEAILDHIVVGEEDGDEAKEQRLIVVSTRRQSVDDHLYLLQEAGLQCLALDVLPLALSRLVLRNQSISSASPLLVVDIGCRYSTAFVLWQKVLIYSRTFLWGASLLTRAIMKDLKLSHEKAELLQQQHGINPQTTNLSILTETDQRINMHAVAGIVCEIVRPHLEYLAQELERILSYWGAQFRGAMIDHMLLSGGGAALKNLDAYLRHRMGIDVAIAAPLRQFRWAGNHSQEPADTPAVATAVGLALRGMSEHG